jgi:peptidoglycan/xylan/chitin deacetylase (PgdA/CDA1 family)
MPSQNRVLIIIVLLFGIGFGLFILANSPGTQAPALPELSVFLQTFTPSPTRAPTIMAMAQTPKTFHDSALVWHPPGVVTAPILLYHHVEDGHYSDTYSITLEKFAAQMQALEDWGYTTITISELIQAIMQGAELPERPIVITFDDGYLNLYENAYPIMQEHGFIGVTYVVGNYVNGRDFMTVEQLLELVDAGWEVGNHSFTHTDLSLDPTLANYEMYQSKIYLEKLLGIPINTFAYPFGGFKPILGDRAWRYGYIGAVGLGKGWTHSKESRYYLERIGILGSYDLEKFARLLPWSGPSE